MSRCMYGQYGSFLPAEMFSPIPNDPFLHEVHETPFNEIVWVVRAVSILVVFHSLPVQASSIHSFMRRRVILVSKSPFLSGGFPSPFSKYWIISLSFRCVSYKTVGEIFCLFVPCVFSWFWHVCVDCNCIALSCFSCCICFLHSLD